jgi:serine protease Do
MIRSFATTLLLAGLATAASYTGAAQLSEQPEPQKAPAPPQVYTVQKGPTTQVYTVSEGSRSYLGVDIRDVDKDRVSALKLKEERGVEVTMVDADAPAGKSGIREHDVILEFNSTPVDSEEQLRRLIRETPPGRTVVLGISRDGNPMKISVQLAEHRKVVSESARILAAPRLPEMPELPNRMDIPMVTIYSTNVGMQTENLTRQLGDFFGVKNGEGVLVRNVEKGSAAEKAGVKAGDVIVRVGDEKLSDRSDLARILRKHRQGGKLSVGIVREKKEQTLTLDLPERGTKDSSFLDDSSFEQLESQLAGLQDAAPILSLRAEELAKSPDWQALTEKLQGRMAEMDKALKRNYGAQTKGFDRQLKKWEELLQKQMKDWDKSHNML